MKKFQGMHVAPSAVGGPHLAVAPTSHVTDNTSVEAGGAAATAVIMFACLCSPGDVGEVFLPVLGAGPAWSRVSAECLVVEAVARSPFCAVGGRLPVLFRRADVPCQRDHVSQGRRRRGDHNHHAGVDLYAVGRWKGDAVCIGRWPGPVACVGGLPECGEGCW